mgnify:CR=1 FL=1
MSTLPRDLERLRTLLRGGTCCSVALVQMGLEHRGEENPLLLQAVSGLCGGVQGGLACGALTGAACMLNVLDPERANAVMVPELTEWFTDTMGRAFGGPNCDDIVHGDPLQKRTRCPGLVEETYLKAREILQAHGYDFD